MMTDIHLSLIMEFRIITVVVLYNLASTKSLEQTETAVSGVHEFCEWESFNVTCAANEVLIIHSARYGRMNLGKCVQKSYGNIGCGTDVTSEMDPRCSGRRHCFVNVISLHSKRSCPPDFKSYLEVDFECRKVAEPTIECPSDSYVLLSEPRAQLASSLSQTPHITEQPVTGSNRCPWRIQVQPYQTINITMVDFSVLPVSGLWYSLQPSQGPVNTCQHLIGYIVERERNVTLCAGLRRQAVVYTSRSNVVDIVFEQSSASAVLLKYSALGCAPIEPPAQAHVRMSASMAVVECNDTREAWYLTCRHTRWVGSFSNCSKPDSYLAGGVDEYEEHSGFYVNSFPFGILLVVALGVAIGVAIGVIMLVAVLLYFRRRGQGRVRSRSTYALHPIDESKYQVSNGLPLEHPIENYVDRCTLLLRREPFQCHTISRDYNAAPKECTMKLKRSQSSQSAGNILDGVLITALPSTNETLHQHAQSLGDFTAAEPGNTRDKSLDYKWDSVSIHDNCNIANKVTTPAENLPAAVTSPYDVDCVRINDAATPFVVALDRRRDEPYYFKYDPNRLKRMQMQNEGCDHEPRPDLVTGCNSCQYAQDALNANV